MSEVRLIDANALAESDTAKIIDSYLYNQCNLTVGFAAALMPEIEAEPVRHGRWIVEDDCERFIARCSECGRSEDSRMIAEMPYCHCGARMGE